MSRSDILRIGVSANFFHPDFERPVFKGKSLLYMEQALAHWLMEQKCIVVLIPSVPSTLSLKEYVCELDGVVFSGGSDVSPKSYGESPLKEEWSGDYVRDQYEIELFRVARSLAKPILGVCRGLQLINVAMGGTLYQDIATQKPDALVHRDWVPYDQLFHEISIMVETPLANLYPKTNHLKINTVHHQAIKDVGRHLVIEAISPKDGIIECASLISSGSDYIRGIQWHPEWQDQKDKSLLDSEPIIKDFMREAKARRV